jgi:hypothetical protein
MVVKWGACRSVPQSPSAPYPAIDNERATPPGHATVTMVNFCAHTMLLLVICGV